ncbi:MAG: hypothetical protein AAGI25_08200 [Bacteroidota bacterium]
MRQTAATEAIMFLDMITAGSKPDEGPKQLNVRWLLKWRSSIFIG